MTSRLAGVALAGVLVGAGLATGACGPAAQESTHVFEVETVDGVQIATNRGGPRFTEPLFTLHEELTLQQDPAVPESLLFRPRDFVRGADGNYYVSDRGNHRIAVFDSAGRYLRAIGSEGQGPGEFAGDAVLMGPIHTEIQAWDATAHHTQRLGLDGAFLGSVVPPWTENVEQLWREPDGSLVVARAVTDRSDSPYMGSMTIGVAGPGAAEPPAMPGTTTMPRWIVTRESVVLDGRTAAYMIMVMVPFGGDPEVYRYGDDLVAVSGDVGRVDWYDAVGALRRSATIERDPRPVTEAKIASFSEKWKAERARDEEEGRDFPIAMPELWYPEFSGWWRQGRMDDAGYLWLQDAEQGTLARDDDLTRYEILAPDGEYLGEMLVPFTDFAVQGGTILARDEDPDTGEQRLRVFRLQPSAPGFVYPGG